MKDSGATAKEDEWKDSRIRETEIGQYFASALRVPHHFIEKGLSIRLGESGQAAVCYDTGLCNLRAAWRGNFLKFDPHRFGLINNPTPDAEVSLLSSPANAWTPKAHFNGFYTHDKRVVLSYDINGVPITESPWIEESGTTTIFTRTFDLGQTKDGELLSVAELKSSTSSTNAFGGIHIVSMQREGKSVAAAVAGIAGATIETTNAQILIHFPPREETSRLTIFLWAGPASEISSFAAIVAKHRATPSLESLMSPTTGRWGSPIATKSDVAGSSSEPYVVDTIGVPYNNPFKALMFLSGVDFFKNGDAAVCTIHGDVWLVRGIDDKLQHVTWQRFATGLFQPLGLKIVDDQVYVLGRDQITRLHDRNKDGEADFYENFCNEINTSAQGHDYVTSLETDRSGQFYYVDPFGLHRVSRDGKRHETLATGWRNPNGMGVSPDRVITVAPQEGNWTPSSAICEVKPGGFYGSGGPQITSERPLGYDPPLCWIPRMVDNSTASQVWVTSDKWGPLKNQMLNLSFGRCSMMLVLREVVDGTAQGGVLTLKPHFLSGAMRGTFRKNDGQLYVVGSLGWSTSATRDGCFQRVRYTGNKAYLPTALRVFETGIQLTFSEPLDRETAEDAGSYGVEEWNYIYSQDYGSKEYSVSQPKEVGHDALDVKSARLSADGRSVFLQIAGLKPVMQMEIQYNINSADGKTVRGEIYNTIHKLSRTDQATLR